MFFIYQYHPFLRDESWIERVLEFDLGTVRVDLLYLLNQHARLSSGALMLWRGLEKLQYLFVWVD